MNLVLTHRYQEKVKGGQEVIKEYNKQLIDGVDILNEEVDNFERALNDYIADQIIKTIFGFFKCFANIFAAAAGGEEPNIGGILNGVWELVDLLEGIMHLIKSVIGLLDLVDELGVDDLDDLTSSPSTEFVEALRKAVDLKLQGPQFDELKNVADHQLTIVNEQTNYGIKGMDKLIMAYSRVSSIGKLLIEEVSGFADVLLALAERKDQLVVAQNDLERAIEQVHTIEQAILEFEQSKNDYENSMNNIQEDYQNSIKEMEEQYANMTAELREKFRQEIMAKFEEFKLIYANMRAGYLMNMDQMVSSIQDKIYGLRTASMTQRSMLMVLYKDYCDTLFYHSFGKCTQDDVPLLGDEMDVLLNKLHNMQWDLITSINNLPGINAET